MLIGQYQANLTDKERLALPKKFRDELGKRVIISRWYEDCLVLVNQASWEKLLSKLTSKATHLIKNVRETDRFIMGSAFELVLDKQGRFIVPKSLKQHAKLVDKAVFVGLGDRIEVWNLDIWKKKEEMVIKEAEKLIEDIANAKDSER